LFTLNTPKKIIFCAYDSVENNSGPSTWLANLLPNLAEQHISIKVLLHYWDAPGPLYKALIANNIPVEAAHCTGFTEDRIQWILQEVADFSPDIFVPNLVTPALLASQYVRKWNIPTIGVLHSDDRFYNAVLDRFVFGRARDSLSAIVCVSKFIEQNVLQRGSRHTLVRRIPYGIKAPSQKQNRIDSATFRIAYVGRLATEQKRIGDVVRAMCLVTKEIPNTEAVVFGDGPDRQIAEDVVRSLASNGKVLFAGRIENTEIPRILQDFDAVLLLSDYEGLPIALLEAMGCGVVPIVTRMQSGIPELIQHRVNGLVVTDREKSVVQAVADLCREPALKQKLSDAARNTIVQNFTHEYCCNLWTQLLRELSLSATSPPNIIVPKTYNLPPVHPDLSNEDPRKPKASKFARARILLGRIRAKYFSAKRKNS
jgi:colanic acid/amylovoran biosynthesis glycosyltransferase